MSHEHMGDKSRAGFLPTPIYWDAFWSEDVSAPVGPAILYVPYFNGWWVLHLLHCGPTKSLPIPIIINMFTMVHWLVPTCDSNDEAITH